MHRTRISLADYSALCLKADVGPNYHPRFVDYYFTALKLKPRLTGVIDQGELVAAYPTLLGQVFPTPIHKRLLGERFQRVAEMGQPETLFPVRETAQRFGLNCLSPTTSPLLINGVRRFGTRSLKAIAIAKERRHKKLTIRQRDFFAAGGKAHFTGEIDAKDFADTYVRLHGERWGRPAESLIGVRNQIIALYDHVFGVVLEANGEAVAAQLCYRATGASLQYVDFINSGVRLQDDNHLSYGSVMMLTTLRRAEQDARAAGKTLRFSFGYYYGDNTYKSVWTDPEPTFIAY
jgi:hypothetical protein